MIPRLQTFRDGPTQWQDWAMAALLDDRTVVLDGPLDEDLALRASTELMLLDGSGDDAVRLRISGTGGTVDGALMLIDVIDLLGVPVHASCVRADGAAAFVFAACPERVMGAHARLRFEEPGAVYSGSGRDIATAAVQHRDRVEQLLERLALASGQPLDDIRALVDDQAVALGLADDVARPEAEVRRFPRRVGSRPQ